MRRMRTRLSLAAAACFVLSLPARAQVAPTLSGETGLFEITNADMLAAGRFSFGLSWSMWTRDGGARTGLEPARRTIRSATTSCGPAAAWATASWTAGRSSSAPARTGTTPSRTTWQGVINGHARVGGFTHSEMDKVRIGTKILLSPRDPVRVALFGGIAIPTQSKNDVNALGTYRTRLRLRRLVLVRLGHVPDEVSPHGQARRRHAVADRRKPATTSRTSGRTRSASPSRSFRTSSRRSASSTASTSTAATRSPSTTPRPSSAAASRSATSRRPAPSASNIDRWAKYGLDPRQHRRPRPVRVRARGPGARRGPGSRPCARSPAAGRDRARSARPGARSSPPPRPRPSRPS